MLWTRRSLVRSASLAAGAAAVSGVLAACSGQSHSANGGSASKAGSSSSALPSYARGDVILNFSANWQSATWNSTAQELNQQFVDEHYNAHNKGFYWQVSGNIQGQAATQVAASLAGKGYFDVYHDCCSDFATLATSGFMTPLNSYLQGDNIDTSIWSKRHVEALTVNGQLLALPAYDGPVTVFYREDLINQAGLTAPGPDWNYQQAQSIWSSCTRTVNRGSTSSHQYGVCFFNDAYDETLDYLLHGWGTTKMNPAGTAFTANNARGASCLSFLQELSTNKVALTRTFGMGPLASGECVFKMCGGWDLLFAAEQLGTGIPWNILPMPSWPNGRSTYVNLDFYVLNKASKYPDQAWQFLKWVTAEPEYQDFQMQVTLVEPCLVNLWEQWQTVVTQAAPPVQGKNIQYIAEAAQQGYAWPERFFKYQPSQAVAIMNNWCAQVWAGTQAPAQALLQMEHQINALESASASSTSSSSTAKA